MRWNLVTTLYVLSVELASCHPSDAPDFEVASRFLENLWTHTLGFFLKIS